MLPWRPRDRARYALLMRVHCSNGGGGTTAVAKREELSLAASDWLFSYTRALLSAGRAAGGGFESLRTGLAGVGVFDKLRSVWKTLSTVARRRSCAYTAPPASRASATPAAGSSHGAGGVVW